MEGGLDEGGGWGEAGEDLDGAEVEREVEFLADRGEGLVAVVDGGVAWELPS
jgi:hypothetical protein